MAEQAGQLAEAVTCGLLHRRCPLQGASQQVQLEWQRRLRMALDAAKGMVSLSQAACSFFQ